MTPLPAGPRTLASVLAVVIVSTGAACATFSGEALDHTVTVEVANLLPASGELTIWMFSRGEFERLGSVPSGATRTFSYDVHWAGGHRLLAHRPAFTSNPNPNSDAPPGELVADSESFTLDTDVGRIRWDTSANYVRVN